MSGRILAIEDEAARMKDEIDEAIVGNLAASGCARLAISNPTRTSGFFWALFHNQRPLCDGDAGLFMVSSETSPNITERKIVHKDLASLEWLAERERAWGRGSAPWTWHVEGMDYRPKSGKEYRFSGRTLAAALRKAIRAGRKVNREWHKKNPPKRLGKKPRR